MYTFTTSFLGAPFRRGAINDVSECIELLKQAFTASDTFPRKRREDLPEIGPLRAMRRQKLRQAQQRSLLREFPAELLLQICDHVDDHGLVALALADGAFVGCVRDAYFPRIIARGTFRPGYRIPTLDFTKATEPDAAFLSLICPPDDIDCLYCDIFDLLRFNEKILQLIHQVSSIYEVTIWVHRDDKDLLGDIRTASTFSWFLPLLVSSNIFSISLVEHLSEAPSNRPPLIFCEPSDVTACFSQPRLSSITIDIIFWSSPLLRGLLLQLFHCASVERLYLMERIYDMETAVHFDVDLIHLPNLIELDIICRHGPDLSISPLFLANHPHLSLISTKCYKRDDEGTLNQSSDANTIPPSLQLLHTTPNIYWKSNELLNLQTLEINAECLFEGCDYGSNDFCNEISGIMATLKYIPNSHMINTGLKIMFPSQVVEHCDRRSTGLLCSCTLSRFQKVLQKQSVAFWLATFEPSVYPYFESLLKDFQDLLELEIICGSYRSSTENDVRFAERLSRNLTKLCYLRTPIGQWRRDQEQWKSVFRQPLWIDGV